MTPGGRMLPAEPRLKEIAERLYASVAAAPIYSPHGHVDAGQLMANEPFDGPSRLLITSDHYIVRLLHALGVPLSDLGLGPGPHDQRRIWRQLAEHWHGFFGTAMQVWFEQTLNDFFAIDEPLSPSSADAIFDNIDDQLKQPHMRPLAILERSNVAVLATSDDPADQLHAHATLPGRTGARVVPTFRVDRYMDPARLGWARDVNLLGAAADCDVDSFAGFAGALRRRRGFFRAHGATSVDVGVPDAWAVALPLSEIEALHRSALSGDIDRAGADAYRRHLLYELAGMSAEDGMVLQLHAGVLRNYHEPTLNAFGPDTGHDLPLPTEYSRPLRELLDRYGSARQFRMVLFTLDETAFTRDIAPLAGFFPSVYVGAPWWFLDAPGAIARFRSAVTDTVGFYKTSGFIDDTRALLSIAPRHEMSRRLDAAHLAGLVGAEQLSENDAARIAGDLVDLIPRTAFRLK